MYKLLIIDDEEHVRIGIRMCIDWEQLGVTNIYEAENGVKGLEMINQINPNIVFLDIQMPGIDGIELLKHSQGASCKFVIISSFNNFEYACEAIKYNVAEYVLKPLDPDAVKKVVINIIEEIYYNKEQNLKIKNIVKENMYRECIQGVIHHEILEQYKNQHVSVGVLRIYFDSLQSVDIKEVFYEIHRAIMGKQTLDNFYFYKSENDLLEAIIILEKSNNEDDENVYEKWNMILDRANQKAEVKCVLAVGSYGCILDEVEKTIEATTEILNNINLNTINNEKIYTGYLLLKRNRKYETQFNENSFIHLILLNGNYEEIVLIVEEYITQLYRQSRITILDLEHIYNEVIILLQYSVSVKKCNIDLPRLIDEYNIKLQFSRYNLNLFRENIMGLINDVVNQFILQSVSQGSIIDEIKKYIDYNYTRDIHLTELAEKFFISREYMSRKFKKEFSCNISEYILELRMKYAKELIDKKTVKVKDVACLVGYKDASYFSRLFKQYYGYAPSETNQ